MILVRCAKNELISFFTFNSPKVQMMIYWSQRRFVCLKSDDTVALSSCANSVQGADPTRSPTPHPTLPFSLV